MDGLGKNLKGIIDVYTKTKEVNVGAVLRERNADMLINFLPTGSKKATEYYAEQALGAECGFINAIPEFICSAEDWRRRFECAGLPLAGDDIKSQVGGTITHRTLVDLFLKRGVRIDESYQSNIGGNTDFLNLLEEERLKTKSTCKNKAVRSLVPYETEMTVTPSNYVSFLRDRKECYITIKGTKFGNTPITVDVKLKIEDSPNSAGVMVDVIRAMKVALDRGLSGPLNDICSYYFKNPPHQCTDEEAYRNVRKFIGEKAGEE